MGDSAIQGYVQDLIQADALFDDDDVTLGDFLVLDRGSPPYAVVLPGAIVEGLRSGDWAQVQLAWEHEVEVFERFLDDDYADFTTARQAAVDAIGQNPTLGGQSGISGAMVVRVSKPRYLYPEGGADTPTFVFSTMTVRTVEEVNWDGSGEFG